MKILLLAACDRVIQDPQFGNSLISVFHGIKFQVPTGAEMPNDAVIPKEWAIFSKWELLPEDEDKPYTSAIKILWPNGTEFIQYRLAAAQPTKTGLAFINRLNGFPVGQAGKIKILQSLECDGAVVYGPEELDIQVDFLAIAEEPPIENNAPVG
jgi:hypothetical protein